MNELTTTSDLDLMRIGKSLGVRPLQVLAVDQLAHVIARRDCSYIINMDYSSGPGTHWTAIYSGPAQRYTVYFDPFGSDADPRVIQFMKRLKKKPIGLSVISQDPKATSCGYWCLYFLNEMRKGVSPPKFLSQISASDTKSNEQMLRVYFSNHN